MRSSLKANEYGWNIKTQAGQRLLTQAVLDSVHEPYSLEEKGVSLSQRPVYARFFVGGWDWYLMEITDLERGIFWGFMNDRTDPSRCEFGSESFTELAKLTIPVPIYSAGGSLVAELPSCVERDTSWKVVPFGEIADIPARWKK